MKMLAITAAALAATAAAAQPLEYMTFELDGAASAEAAELVGGTSLGNTSGYWNVGGPATLVTVEYSVTIETFAGSWLSEASLLIADAGLPDTTNGITFSFAPDAGNPGTITISGLLDLRTDFVDGGGNPVDATIVDADGLFYYELFESFDDDLFGGILPGDTEAIVSGSITLGYAVVPTPGAAALLGLGGLAGLRRRR